jgi:hypothetical protein
VPSEGEELGLRVETRLKCAVMVEGREALKETLGEMEGEGDTLATKGELVGEEARVIVGETLRDALPVTVLEGESVWDGGGDMDTEGPPDREGVRPVERVTEGHAEEDPV